MNRSLIRATQLNPDVSGLVYQYTKDVYPEYRTYSGVSGVDIVSGAGRVGLVSAGSILSSGIVNKINNITGGSIFLTGQSGISIYQSGTNSLILSYIGGSVQSINGAQGAVTLTGLGNVSISNNYSTVSISGRSITGQGGVLTYNSGEMTYIDGRRLVYTANGQTGNINLVGSGGVYVYSNSGTLIIDGTYAANSGIMALNGKKGFVNLTGYAYPSYDSRMIEMFWDVGYNSFIIRDKGMGWGMENIPDSLSSNQVYIGDHNSSLYGHNVLTHGDYNNIDHSSGIVMLNGAENYINTSSNVAMINSSESDIENISNTTLINGNKMQDLRSNAFVVGNGIPNSSFDIIGMRSISTGETLKFLKPQKSSTYGIFVPIGSVLVGEMDYVFLNSNINDFWANFKPMENGTYGKKYFMIQRNNDDTVSIKDQADLFGGSQSYQVGLSGANDGNFYVYSSGVSGQDHISQASLRFSAMSFQDFVYNSDTF